MRTIHQTSKILTVYNETVSHREYNRKKTVQKKVSEKRVYESFSWFLWIELDEVTNQSLQPLQNCTPKVIWGLYKTSAVPSLNKHGGLHQEGPPLYKVCAKSNMQIYLQSRLRDWSCWWSPLQSGTMCWKKRLWTILSICLLKPWLWNIG